MDTRTHLTLWQWQVLEPLLPPSPHRGYAWVDHWRVISGIGWYLRTSSIWRDIPQRYDPWQTCCNRFVR